MGENKEINSISDLQKLQTDMRQRFESHVRMLAALPTTKPEELIKLRAADMGHTKAALADAERERDTIVKYWNDRVERLRARVGQQDAEIKLVKQTLKTSNPKVAKPARKK